MTLDKFIFLPIEGVVGNSSFKRAFQFLTSGSLNIHLYMCERCCQQAKATHCAAGESRGLETVPCERLTKNCRSSQPHTSKRIVTIQTPVDRGLVKQVMLEPYNRTQCKYEKELGELSSTFYAGLSECHTHVYLLPPWLSHFSLCSWPPLFPTSKYQSNPRISFSFLFTFSEFNL